MLRLLPWEYGVRNLFRRPLRSGLTLLALTLVVLLVLVAAGFVRGLESSLDVSGDPNVVLVHARTDPENLEVSTVPGRTAPVLAASVAAVRRRYDNSYVSPELFLGTRIATEDDATPALGLIRGVTPTAQLVRRSVQLTDGNWPKPGEVLVGRLAGAKLGRTGTSLAIGKTLTFEGRDWRVSGRFAAVGSALEAELWCPLEDLQHATRRQDYSLVAMTLAPGSSFADVDEFCKERLDLELAATRETDYYAGLRRYYGPVRLLAWSVALLVAGAGIFAGMNAMYGSVLGRVRELATLQTIGFPRRSLVVSLVQEAALLAAAAVLLAATLAVVVMNGLAVRFTMGAFTLRIDGGTLLAGAAAGLAIGVCGALPPAWQALRLPIVDALKSV